MILHYDYGKKIILGDQLVYEFNPSIKHMKKKIFTALVFLLFINCLSGQTDNQVRGWNILSDSYTDDIKTIEAAPAYNINHLQLSHDIIMDLKEVRDNEKQKLANDLISKAHKAGIKEVVVWDHALYGLSYYPEIFRTGPKGSINFDNPEFWKWLKQDYRDMLKLIPGADGIVLTFIETGARAENQFSEKLLTGAEKLAAVVDAIADVVCDEQHKKLYIRTFAYTDAEYLNTIGCIGHIKNDKIILMMKETPHDFFLTHPNDKYAGTIKRPTIIEFDAANEFNGQGIIANTWPEYIIRRWSDLIKRPCVLGYVARTDRYRNTHIVGTPNEVLLYALKRYTENQDISPEEILDEFISSKYGKEAIQYLKPAFNNSYDIVSSSLYTLGTNVANHSKMEFDSYKSSYGRHVSGKWLDPPVVTIGHGVNMDFNYWKDIIEHIAPAPMKEPGAGLAIEAPEVIEQNQVTPVEKMDEEYLRYILTEKDYGVKKAEEALTLIRKSKNVLSDTDYRQVYNLFYRTLLTARIYKSTAVAYFGYRIYVRGEKYRSDWLCENIQKSLEEMQLTASDIDNYKDTVPRGQWNWRGDAETARRYHRLISETGWKEYGNVVFKPKPGSGKIQKPITELSWKQVATGMPESWYGSGESVEVAENVLLYQREAGGWPKNTSFHLPIDETGKAAIQDQKGTNDAIFDNSATTTEMKFLARMYNKTGNKNYKESFNKGLKFILDAQYENGGWPMFYPLRRGYYTHITFNDNAIVNILTMLGDIRDKDLLYVSITDTENFNRTGEAFDKGIAVILKTQIIVDGKPTVWCAQHDENTLLPAKARSYELPSFSGAESVGIVKLLMKIPDPSPDVINSIDGAMKWFDSHRLKNTRWDVFTNNEGKTDRRIVTDPVAGDMWARFYDLDTEEPYVCDRDGIKKKRLDEIGYERRNGYSWFTDDPEELFRLYPEWRNKWFK
jgi:PelA/Pel-15E family pectate lyase